MAGRHLKTDAETEALKRITPATPSPRPLVDAAPPWSQKEGWSKQTSERNAPVCFVCVCVCLSKDEKVHSNYSSQ